MNYVVSKKSALRRAYGIFIAGSRTEEFRIGGSNRTMR